MARWLRRTVVEMVDHGWVVYRHAHRQLHVRHRGEYGVDCSRVGRDMLAIARRGKDCRVNVQVRRVR